MTIAGLRCAEERKYIPRAQQNIVAMIHFRSVCILQLLATQTKITLRSIS